MDKIVVGTFSDQEHADMALSELDGLGFEPNDISVIVKESINRSGGIEVKDKSANVKSGAVTGATTGGLLGGVAGLLVGTGAIAIPGIGGVLVSGPLVAFLGLTGAAAGAVQGTVTGVLAGGLVGGLAGLGLPEEVARTYEERIKSGGVVVAVESSEIIASDVKTILDKHHASDIHMVDRPAL
jgi:hypothetical protein